MAGVPPENLQCRFYEKQYPDIDEAVMVNVRSVQEMGAYVSLLEYNNVEGMILLSELSRRRIRSIPKLIRVGRNEVVVVLRVDKDKGYIDLSKRRVSPEEITAAEEKFNKAKEVHSIMRHVAKVCNRQLESLYVKFGWPLYRKYGHAFEAFKRALIEPEAILGEFELEPEIKEVLLKNIERRMTPQRLKIRADIEVSCFSYEGINAIKAALSAGEVSRPDGEVEVKLVAPPLFVMVTNTLDKKAGIDLLNEAIGLVRTSIEAAGGKLVVKTAPRATSDREEKDLTQMLDDLEKQNQEVDGDLDSEDDSAAGDAGDAGPADESARAEPAGDDDGDDE